MKKLIQEVRDCTMCEEFLEDGVRPVLQVSSSAKVLIAGQAPGRRVHESGIPFDDPSGDRLREWMGVDRDVFYDAKKIAILPMGFCYPGTGKSGDLPPRPECAEAWREQLLAKMKRIDLTLVIGQYALSWHLPDAPKKVTDAVRAWRDFAPDTIPLPHPSPRNNIWLRKNAWFEADVLPELRKRIRKALRG